MSNHLHVGVVKALYAAFAAGDDEKILNLVTDDVVFEIPGMPGVPLGTRYHGKSGVQKFLADRGPALTYTAFAPDKFFSDQDHVIVLGQTAGTVKTTGKSFGYKWVQLFEISSDNRVRRFHEFMDTHELVSAFTGP
jgi:ketosteroid isomerase-like protein